MQEDYVFPSRQIALIINVFNNGGVTNAAKIPPNTWVHYAVTINSSNFYNVYLNCQILPILFHIQQQQQLLH